MVQVGITNTILRRVPALRPLLPSSPNIAIVQSLDKWTSRNGMKTSGSNCRPKQYCNTFLQDDPRVGRSRYPPEGLTSLPLREQSKYKCRLPVIQSTSGCFRKHQVCPQWYYLTWPEFDVSRFVSIAELGLKLKGGVSKEEVGGRMGEWGGCLREPGGGYISFLGLNIPPNETCSPPRKKWLGSELGPRW